MSVHPTSDQTGPAQPLPEECELVIVDENKNGEDKKAPEENGQEKKESAAAGGQLTTKKKVRNGGLLFLKAVSVATVIWDVYSSWEIYHYFVTGSAGLPDDATRIRISVAWGVFASIGVFTALLSLWDMFVETLEDWKIAGKLKGKRIEPHNELWIAATLEEIPQSTILLIVLINYSVVGPDTPIPAFIEESLYEVFLDSGSIVARLISAFNKLYKIVKENVKEPRARDVAIIVIDIIEIVLLIALAITYTVIKNQKGL